MSDAVSTESTSVLTNHATDRERYVSVDIADNAYCLPASVTVELMRMPASGTKCLPRSPAWVAGMLNHRGMVVPVVDMRVVLGCKSYKEEIAELTKFIDARQRELQEWIDELRESVKSGKPFTKSTSATKCSFGQWYDTLNNSREAMEKLTRGDLGMATLIKEFAKPHKHMCSVAERAQHMAKNGKSDEALTLINTSDSHDFSQIKHLFERLINQFKAQRHPMLVVIETDIGRTALMIDSVREVVELGQADIDPIPTGVKTHDLVRGISHRNRQMPVLVFDEHALRTLGVEIDQDEQSLAA